MSKEDLIRFETLAIDAAMRNGIDVKTEADSASPSGKKSNDLKKGAA